MGQSPSFPTCSCGRPGQLRTHPNGNRALVFCAEHYDKAKDLCAAEPNMSPSNVGEASSDLCRTPTVLTAAPPLGLSQS